LKLDGIIYSPDFQLLPKFIFCFHAKEDYESIENQFILNANVYFLSGSPYYKSFSVDRRFTIEHAAINNDFSAVKGLSDDSDIYQFAYSTDNWIKDSYVCCINKFDFKLKSVLIKDLHFEDAFNNKIMNLIYGDNNFITINIFNRLGKNNFLFDYEKIFYNFHFVLNFNLNCC
jgi:hypothetical protein